jgi:hypothetical protein
MEKKKEKVDMFSKFQKKAEETKKALEEKANLNKANIENNPEKIDSGSSQDTPPSSSMSGTAFSNISSSGTNLESSFESVLSSNSIEAKPVLTIPSAHTQPSAEPNKLSRWLQKSTKTSPGESATTKGARCSDDSKVHTTPGSPPSTTSLQTNLKVNPGSVEHSSPESSSKPVFGTPFQGLEDGSGWWVPLKTILRRFL